MYSLLEKLQRWWNKCFHLKHFPFAIRLEAIASRLEAIAIRLEAIAIRLGGRAACFWQAVRNIGTL